MISLVQMSNNQNVELDPKRFLNRTDFNDTPFKIKDKT